LGCPKEEEGKWLDLRLIGRKEKGVLHDLVRERRRQRAYKSDLTEKKKGEKRISVGKRQRKGGRLS